MRKCVERYEGDVVLFVGEGRGGVNASSDEARSMSHWSPYDRVRRGARRFLRTFSPGRFSSAHSLAFNPRPSTPFNSASDAFQLRPDVRSHTERRPQTFDALERTHEVVRTTEVRPFPGGCEKLWTLRRRRKKDERTSAAK